MEAAQMYASRRESALSAAAASSPVHERAAHCPLFSLPTRCLQLPEEERNM
jgi:hypothetical protein